MHGAWQRRRCLISLSSVSLTDAGVLQLIVVQCFTLHAIMPRKLSPTELEAAGLAAEEGADLLQYMSDGEEKIIADSGPSRVRVGPRN